MSVAKKMEEAMKTRATATTEEHERKSHIDIIADSKKRTKNQSATIEAEVTTLPLLPVYKDGLKILELSLFDDVEMKTAKEEVLDFPDLKTFVKSAPALDSYRIDIVKGNGTSRKPHAIVVLLRDEDKKIVLSKVAYYHLIKTHNLDDKIDGCILVTYRDGITRQLQLQMSDVSETQKLVKTMANRGILTSHGAMNRDYIYEQNLECEETRFLVNTLGFNQVHGQSCFVYPEGKSIGAPVYYSNVDPEMKHALGISGDANAWIENVILPLNLKNEIPSIPFLFFSALMPLFSKIVPGFQGILINITPDEADNKTSSNGKTTLQRGMLSMQGSQAWMVSWNMTANAIEGKLHNGFGAYFDDLSTSSIKNMEKVVYDNANGTQRGRLNQDGTTKKIKQRNSVIFSSGETQALDIDKTKDGALVRAIDIAIKASDFGSDDINHTKTVADSITATVRDNYGFVYWVVIHMIIDHPNHILEQIRRYKSHFVSMAQDSLSKRLALTYAIITACGDLMVIAIQKLSGDPTMLSQLDPLHITAAMFRKVIVTLSQKNDKHLLVLDLIKQSVILDDGGVTIRNTYNTPIGIVDNSIWYIKSTEVTQTIKEMDNIFANRFFRWAYAIGYLHEIDSEEGHFTKNKRINGNGVKTYAFNFDLEIDGNPGNRGNKR